MSNEAARKRWNEQLLRDLSETVNRLPTQASPRIAEFSGDTAGAARNAASAWLNDFNLHGPLEIESINTGAYEGRFVAVVAYWAEGSLRPVRAIGAR